MEWYIVKVQTNRETAVRDAILRAIKQDGPAELFGTVLVPTEKVVDQSSGRKRVREEKLFPGYILVQMRLTDDSWYLVRHVAGVGDFAGVGGVPTALGADDVRELMQKIAATPTQQQAKATKFRAGDRVKVTAGAFEGFEGVIDSVDTDVGGVSILIEIFGRPTPINVTFEEVGAVE